MTLYSQYEHPADCIMGRVHIKNEIVKCFFTQPTAPYIRILSPCGAGTFAFAKSCLNAAGFSRHIVMDALDASGDELSESSGGYGIQQSLYSRSQKIAYIFRNGYTPPAKLPSHTPIIWISHSTTSPLESHSTSDDHISTGWTTFRLDLPSETQCHQLFVLYTGDSTIGKAEFKQWFTTTPCGHMCMLMRTVTIYRTHMRFFLSFMAILKCASTPMPLCAPDLSQTRPATLWNVPDTSLYAIRQMYIRDSNMPTSNQMYELWPRYTSNTWRIVLRYYADIARIFTWASHTTSEMCFWYMARMFQMMPERGQCAFRPEYCSSSRSQYMYMRSMFLYSTYSFRMAPDEIELFFRRIYNAYYAKNKSIKNKITTKTKKISLEMARTIIFRESREWNEKLFRKWIYYIADITM